MNEPRIVCFFCKWCTYAGADLAGTSRKQYPANGVVVRVNCTGRVDPQHVLWAFREGADGVLIGGCHPGDCHYEEGNYKTMRRVPLLHRLMEGMGVEPERLRLEWISAAEGQKLVEVMNEFVDTVKDLGPLELSEDALKGNGGAPRVPAGPRKAAAKTQARPAAKKAKKTTKKKAKAGKAGTARRKPKSAAKKKTATTRKKSTAKKAKPGSAVKKKTATATKKTASRRKTVKTKTARKKTTRKVAARKKSPAKKPRARATTRRKR